MAYDQRKSKPRVTAEIIEVGAARPLHLLPRQELARQAVSSRSCWDDTTWSLDHSASGADNSRSKFRWDIDLPNGQKLTNPVFADMLDWLRRLVWSLVAAPAGEGGALSTASMSSLSPGFRYFVRWLCVNHITWPKELDTLAASAYLKELEHQAEDEVEHGRRTDPTQAEIYNKLRPLSFLWQQRAVLERAGIEPMPGPPFGRRTAHDVTKKIAKIAFGAYRPLPDEVAIPIMNTSLRMLQEPAEDVIALAHGCLTALSSSRTDRIALRAQKTFIQSFEFQEVNGRPWHWPLDPDMWNKEHVRKVRKGLEAIVDRARNNNRRPGDASRKGGLPFITKIRPYIDSKRLLLEAGADASEAGALFFNDEWRSVVEEQAKREGLFLQSSKASHRVRQLVVAIQSAAHVVIQATTGMRVGEIAALEAGCDETTGLPSSVKVRDSTSGLGEVFILRSKLSKTEETPRSVEWTLGYRLKGSSELPPAVVAMQVVDRLMAPWRVMLGTESLFLHFTNTLALPKSASGISSAMSYRLRDTVRDFIEEWVDLTGLPDDAARPTLDRELVPYRESHGRNFKTHQLRKLFANFAYRVDGRMLPILQMHFHHVSIAMTDGGYIMSDPALLRERDDVRHQHSALLALDTARGLAPLAGQFGDELEQMIKGELGRKIEFVDSETAYDEAFNYVDEAGLDRLFYEPYGICGARSASKMACHKAGGTEGHARWAHRLAPNYDTREPSLCAGCPSFVIAKWHRPYWEDRYIAHAVPLALAQVQGDESEEADPFAAVTSFRMRQALALARKLGADPSALERRVDARVKELLDA
ncbi:MULTISPECIES: hypothetical protein [Thioclava]|uniref:hypothetical protein n=1 Tax=Thioclava TaxID=285107 RepID=UPI00113033AD|nr:MULTISPECIES: hypothetical protein [Thioclava]MBC7146555.1 hypothetical protein [Thioclava marina]